MSMEVLDERQRTLQDEADKKLVCEGVTDLLKDIGSMLNNRETSDVAFICKDGDKVYASRWFLSLRCQVFKAMFTHEMMESKLVEVPLRQFSSSTMHGVFEYLHTGVIEPQSWKGGFEVIRAANFFLIYALEVICQKFLSRVTFEACKDGDRNLIMDMLSEAFEFHESWRWKDEMLLELTNVLHKKSQFHSTDGFHRLSKDAMDFFLSQVKGSEVGNADRKALNEYHMLRQIVLWHVYQKLSQSSAAARQKIMQKVQKILPTETEAPELWISIFESKLNAFEYTRRSSKASESPDPTAVLKSCVGIDICKISFQRLLGHVDWRKMPTVLMLKVVQPLEVVRPHAIIDALAFQATHAPVNTWAYKTFEWKCTKNLTCNAGTVLCKSKDGLRSLYGRAIARLPIEGMHGTCEWQFEIQEHDANYISVGFICGSVTQPWDLAEDDFEQQGLWSYWEPRVVCINCGLRPSVSGQSGLRLDNYVENK